MNECVLNTVVLEIICCYLFDFEKINEYIFLLLMDRMVSATALSVKISFIWVGRGKNPGHAGEKNLWAYFQEISLWNQKSGRPVHAWYLMTKNQKSFSNQYIIYPLRWFSSKKSVGPLMCAWWVAEMVDVGSKMMQKNV